MFRPFSRDAGTEIYHGHLPHWRQNGVMYFVTTRLADSIPKARLQQWLFERSNWLAANGCQNTEQVEELPEALRKEYHERFTAGWHKFLDSGHGECLLRDTENAAIVAGALRHFDGTRYWLGDFVVMPNHLHVLVIPGPGHELSKILQSWKGFTAHAINKRIGRSGSFWQSESFDHIVRSDAQYERFRRYISENPIKARLPMGSYLHWRRSDEE